MKKYKRGQYVRKLIKDYCVLDIETTGLSCQYDHIIEIGILKVRNHQVVSRYQQLINPQVEISAFITQLTGITNKMVENQPLLEELYDEVFDFIGDDVIVGHNTSFDLNFIANQFQVDLKNEYVDTVQLSKKVYPELRHHRLTDMVEYLGLSNNEHRALADCIATYELYERCQEKLKDL